MLQEKETLAVKGNEARKVVLVPILALNLKEARLPSKDDFLNGVKL
jgi:hypothetical protein